MITISLKQLDASWTALQTLSQLQLPAKVSYRLSRILSSAESQYKQMTESIQTLFKSHGAEVKDERLTITDPEQVAAFNAEVAELMTEVVELWGDPFPIEMLGDVEVSPATLLPLDWLITDNEPEKAKVANG